MFSRMLNPVVMSVFLYLCTPLPRGKLKMTVFLIFGRKWNIIAHNALTTEGKQAATKRVNRICIQLPFDTTFIPVSFIVEWVFLFKKKQQQIFDSGDPLVAGFESRPAGISTEKGQEFPSLARSP